MQKNDYAFGFKIFTERIGVEGEIDQVMIELCNNKIVLRLDRRRR